VEKIHWQSALEDEKLYYLESAKPMKIYATKSRGSFAVDCKGNFSQLSCFFSYGFCSKRLLESMLATAQPLTPKFNVVQKYHHRLSGVANQSPVVMRYWRG